VLNDGTFLPVGGDTLEKVDVRIISATNKNINQLLTDGNFREDLYYRLVKDIIILPPLRDRGDDKRLIAENVIFKLNEKYGKNKKLTQSAIDFILKNDWQGNVRQLENVLERAFIYSGDEITEKDLNIINLITEPEIISIPDEGVDFDTEIVPKYYEVALRKTHGNMAKAAELLGLEAHTFRKRLQKLKIGKYK
jgi:transcriptional regulator with PAS, ATPase and Fis domain